MTVFDNYSTYIILAGLVSVSGIYFSAVKKGFSKKFIFIFLALTLFSTFVGARLLNYFTNKLDYLEGKISLFTLNFQGFSLYGGLALALLVGFLICKKFKVNLFRLSDLAVPFIGIGIGIVRIGCFVHGCCFGRQTDSIFGIYPKIFSPAHIHEINHGGNPFLPSYKVHPTQIYEMIGALFSSFVAFYLLRKKVKTGIPTFMFTLIFTSFRLIIYFFRENTDSFNMSNYFYPVLYSGIILISVLLLMIIKKLDRAIQF